MYLEPVQEFKSLPDYGKITFEIDHSEGLSRQELPNATDDVLNFIKQLLVLRPIERLPARQVRVVDLHLYVNSIKI